MSKTSLLSDAPARTGLRDILRVGRARRLVFASTVDSVGTGLFMAASALFLTTRVDLTNTQVGIGLGVAGAVGFITTVPVSSLGDRIGPRALLMGLMCWRAAGFVAYAFIANFVQFLLVAALIAMGDRVASPVLQGLVGAAVAPDQRVATMALVRTSRNVGFVVGAGLAGAALHFDGLWPYRWVILGNAASFLLAALALASVSVRRPVEVGGSGARLAFLRDRRYLLLTFGNGVMSLHMTMLTVGFPLWAIQGTATAQQWIPLIMALNMIMAVCLQIPVATRVFDLSRASRAYVFTGLALGASCVLYALAPGLSGFAVLGCLALAMVAMTAGELFQSAAAWEVSFGLAPEARRNAYLGVFSLGVTGQQIVGPALIGSIVVVAGAPGWIVLGIVFLSAGFAMAAAVPIGSSVDEDEVAKA